MTTQWLATHQDVEVCEDDYDFHNATDVLLARCVAHSARYLAVTI